MKALAAIVDLDNRLPALFATLCRDCIVFGHSLWRPLWRRLRSPPFPIALLEKLGLSAYVFGDGGSRRAGDP